MTKNNIIEKQANTIVEGLTSLSAIIKAIESGKNSRKIFRVLVSSDVAKNKTGKLSFLRRKETELGYELSIVTRDEIDAICNGRTHGGIAALCSERHLTSLPVDKLPTKGFFVLIEGIEDPYNFGYTVRSLYAAGVEGIILGERNWMTAATTVIKSSAGTSELLDIYQENPVMAVKKFKQMGYKIIGAGIRDSVSLYSAELKLPMLLIIGGERRGISRSLLELVDEIVRIDYGREFMGSLTTSASAAIIAFEVMRKNK